MPLVDVMTTSFVRWRILSTVSWKISNRDVGRSFSSRQWTWMIEAPSCSQRYAVSAISSGVTGTCGVSFFRGTEPVGATVMISFSAASPRARYAAKDSKGCGTHCRGLAEEVTRNLHVRRNGLQDRLGEFVKRDAQDAPRSLNESDRLEGPKLFGLRFDDLTEVRLHLGRRGGDREREGAFQLCGCEEASERLAGGDFPELTDDFSGGPAAPLEGDRAPRVESASGWDVRGVRPFALQDDPLPPPIRVRDRHDGDERLRVRMPRILDQFARGPFLDDLAEVHDADPVREDPRKREVVGDEEVREAFLVPQLDEELQDLRADRHVEHGARLIGHEELWIEDERTRDRHSLPLSPESSCGYRKRKSRGGRKLASVRACSTRDSVSARFTLRPFTTSGSATMSYTDCFGFRDSYGSWKIICSFCRRLRILIPSSPSSRSRFQIRTRAAISPTTNVSKVPPSVARAWSPQTVVWYRPAGSRYPEKTRPMYRLTSNKTAASAAITVAVRGVGRVGGMLPKYASGRARTTPYAT